MSGLDLLLWALALMLVLEGLLPALLPRQWRQWFAQLLRLHNAYELYQDLKRLYPLGAAAGSRRRAGL